MLISEKGSRLALMLIMAGLLTGFVNSGAGSNLGALLGGRPVSTTAPTSGQAQVWNGTQYAPTTVGMGGGVSGLTTTRVPFATSSTALGDDSDMTFSVDTLTVTKLTSTVYKNAAATSAANQYGCVYVADTQGLVLDNDIIGGTDTVTLTASGNNTLTVNGKLAVADANGITANKALLLITATDNGGAAGNFVPVKFNYQSTTAGGLINGLEINTLNNTDYTGNADVSGLRLQLSGYGSTANVFNLGTDTVRGNIAARLLCTANDAGLSIGVHGASTVDVIGIGLVGSSGTNTTKSIGVVGGATNDFGETTCIGGWFCVNDVTFEPSMLSCALGADAGNLNTPIFLGRAAGATVFDIAASGNTDMHGHQLTTGAVISRSTAGLTVGNADGTDCEQVLPVRLTSTNSAAVQELSIDNAGSIFLPALAAGDTYTYVVTVAVRGTAGTNANKSASYTIKFTVERTGATTRIVNDALEVISEEVAGWNVTVTADDTNDRPAVNFVPDAADTGSTIHVRGAAHAFKVN